MNESDFLQAISSRGVFEDPLHETSLPADNAAAGAFKNTQGKGPNRHWPLVDGDHLAPDQDKPSTPYAAPTEDSARSRRG